MKENQTTNNNRSRLVPNLWVGLIFIFGGAVVLLNQTDVLSFELNWWALFILFPAFAAFNGAYNRYRSTNDLLAMGVMMPAITGLVMLFLCFSMLFSNMLDIDWGSYWPVILIFPAFGLFLGAYNRYRATNGLLDMGVLMPALIGLFMLSLSIGLLLGNPPHINWNLYWPVILIIIGIGMILGRGRRS